MKEIVNVGELRKYLDENSIPDSYDIWVDFGQGYGTFLRNSVTGNINSKVAITHNNSEFGNGTLRLHMPPSCFIPIETDAKHPVVLTTDKTPQFNNN